MKRLIALAIALYSAANVSAQELNCDVSVLSPQIQGTQTRVYESLEVVAEDFLNGRKWTDDEFLVHERIDVTIQITINEMSGLTSFSGSIQIQSSRPVYNSDYKSPVFFVNDQDFQFTFLENSLIQFSLDQHRDNLSSVLAYYAYMIIATDYDTFSPNGGTPYFLKAQQIVANAQNAGERGWRSGEGQTNRYWLVENILSQSFAPLRQCLYDYHRNGFDKLYDNLVEGRKVIGDALLELRRVHQIRPSSYNLQNFFYPKLDELVNLFKPAPLEEKTRVYDVLKLVDPGNIQRYEGMMKN
jgi:hypothetical protein